MFWKFHWVWLHVGGSPRIIKKMTDFWKTVLDSSQCQKRIDEGSWVSLALATWLRIYNIFYFGSFTEFDVISEDRPKLSRKWRFSGKIVLDSSQCQKCTNKGSWFSLTLVTWLRIYNLFYFGSFTEFDAISEKRPELSIIMWICVSNMCFNNNSWIWLIQYV